MTLQPPSIPASRLAMESEAHPTLNSAYEGRVRKGLLVKQLAALQRRMSDRHRVLGTDSHLGNFSSLESIRA
jgi:hypothetical protein